MSTNIWRQVRDARDKNAMAFIAMRNVATQRAVAKFLNTDPAVVCRIVKRLRDAGLVRRVVDGVELTARGRAKLNKGE